MSVQNRVFVILNVLLLLSGLGGVVWGTFSKLYSATANGLYFTWPSTLFYAAGYLALGGVLVLVPFFAFCSVRRQSACCVTTYLAHTVIISILTLSITVAAFLVKYDCFQFQGNPSSYIVARGSWAYAYAFQPDLLIDIQLAEHCCGFSAPGDLQPQSSTTACSYPSGCEVFVEDALDWQLLIVGISIAALTVLIFVLIVFACAVRLKFKRDVYLRIGSTSVNTTDPKALPASYIFSQQPCMLNSVSLWFV
eukprot:TRINITY_DN1510_c0_g1_i2.p1 TRINITY_DN1510_c0_g1~~TRINITY_DN1510_c0_g1_i2.p1  ORF type:complete len:251 (+),score=35.65 TRINITY_DN1510_c0_g1_i2:44-796(+)